MRGRSRRILQCIYHLCRWAMLLSRNGCGQIGVVPLTVLRTLQRPWGKLLSLCDSGAFGPCVYLSHAIIAGIKLSLSYNCSSNLLNMYNHGTPPLSVEEFLLLVP